jgi:hypothetical protein
MERRKTPRKEWIITKDDVGRAVLEWTPDPLRAKRLQESDPCARTYDFLARLDVPDLEIEDEVTPRASTRSFNPYDHSAPPVRRKRLGS